MNLLFLVTLVCTSCYAVNRGGSASIFHNSQCLHDYLTIHSATPAGTIISETIMTCQRIRVRCSELPTARFVTEALRFETFPRECTTIAAINASCVVPPHCMITRTLEFEHEYRNERRKLCVGVLASASRYPYGLVKYTKLPENLPNFNNYLYFDDDIKRNVSIVIDEYYRAFDPIAVCDGNDEFARIIPKDIFNQMLNSSHHSETFVSVESSTDYVSVFVNINPNATDYYNAEIFPFPFKVHGWRYNYACNSSAPAHYTELCRGKTPCMFNGFEDQKCSYDTVYRPYRYCMGQLYGERKACPTDLQSYSVSSRFAMRAFTQWYFPTV